MFVAILSLVFPLVVVSMSTDDVPLSRFEYEFKIIEQLVNLSHRIVDLEKSNSEKDRTIRNLTEVSTDDVPCSRFEYEYKIIEQLVNLTNRIVELEKSNSEKERTIRNLTEEILQLENIRGRPGGSVYIRWGKHECPDESRAELIYRGYAGGSYYSHTGGAANLICLPEEPTWSNYSDKVSTYGAFVYGAEYSFGYSQDAPQVQFIGSDLHQHDVPCAVCRSRRPSMVMIPGRNDCFDSWTVEYTGYLSAGSHHNNAASEYVCLDANPEMVDGGTQVQYGALFYLVEAGCGSLKCPPYVKGRELSCVVCTK